MKNSIYLLIAIILFTSCEETIILDTDQAASKTVIEAYVTDIADRQYVRITKTADFYSQDGIPSISNATVTVTDGNGTIHNYSESTGEPGYYYPDVDFVGQVNLSYELHVDVNGEVFTANDVLLPISPIDSLSIEIDEDEKEDPEDEGQFYTAHMYAKEPQDEENFYMFKFYKNGAIDNDDGSDIFVTNDIGVGESLDGIETPYYYSIGDTVGIEMISLSRECYVYFADLTNLVSSDGGIFLPQPANPRTNISGGALGFFQVSSVSRQEIRIE